MENKITGCVFDLDGTLADTAPDIAIALNNSLNDAGLRQVPLESVKEMIGNGIPVLVRRALFHIEAPEDLAADVVTSMLAYSRKYYCEKSSLMHGVKDCLEGLKKRGIPMSICTNKDETVAQMVVSALDLNSYFYAIVGSRPNLVKKPDPSMLQIAAEAINSPMETTMMIGDSEVDAATGIAASSISVIVRGGYCHKPYEELNVTHLLDSMEELLDIIDNQYLISV
tara:strand:- start:972 stop:1649 length:678 start_codon:yes stop_codon:yes gene_type:complete